MIVAVVVADEIAEVVAAVAAAANVVVEMLVAIDAAVIEKFAAVTSSMTYAAVEMKITVAVRSLTAACAVVAVEKDRNLTWLLDLLPAID